MSISAIKEFFYGLTQKNIFFVITHCDQYRPSESEVVGQLDALRKYGFDCPRDHVILFNKTVAPLKAIISKISAGAATIHSNIT